MRCEYRKAYTQQKSNAKRRGVEMRLSFTEWLEIWSQSGKWDERGRGSNKYCMCRLNDEGHYEIANVYISTNKRNLSEGNAGKVLSELTKQKIGASKIGKPRPDIEVTRGKPVQGEAKGMGYIFPSAAAAGRLLNIAQSSITQACQGKRQRASKR